MRNLFLCLSLLIFTLYYSVICHAFNRGIYLTQYTLENTERVKQLIAQAKSAGINTFVVDLEKPGKRYEQNIALVKQGNINYVARITMFPDGGTADEIRSVAYWEKKYALVTAAIQYGASEIQLDYIRYKASQKASPQNSHDVHNVIRWFKEKLAAQHIPLQIDVFGIASFGESKHIGQNIKLFSQTIDVLCPMLYPSHFEPFREHAVTPYETVYSSLNLIKKQFENNKVPFKLNPYIELSNYRYPLSEEKKLKYIVAQIKATEDAGADGWYAWSAHNQYDNLFKVLSMQQH